MDEVLLKMRITKRDDTKESFTFRKHSSKKSLNLHPQEIINYKMKMRSPSNFGGYMFPKSNKNDKPPKMMNLFVMNRKKNVFNERNINCCMPDKEAAYLDRFGRVLNNHMSAESSELNKIQEHLNSLNLKVLSKCKNSTKIIKRF